jgi:hypothetical protein
MARDGRPRERLASAAPIRTKRKPEAGSSCLKCRSSSRREIGHPTAPNSERPRTLPGDQIEVVRHLEIQRIAAEFLPAFIDPVENDLFIMPY